MIAIATANLILGIAGFLAFSFVFAVAVGHVLHEVSKHYPVVADPTEWEDFEAQRQERVRRAVARHEASSSTYPPAKIRER